MSRGWTLTAPDWRLAAIICWATWPFSGWNPDRRSVLTCKEPAADAVSGSKPEHETKVADAAVVDEILRAFGLEHLVAVRGDVRAILGELGIGEDDPTTEQHTDAVLHASA